jgi:RNA polymerase sigma-70 factor (ECF subfamily)
LPDLHFADEKALLGLIAGGDQKAFTKLVDLYWNKVYSHALAYVKSSPRAKEITQDVFLRLWNKKEALNEVVDFKSFLFVLGKNQIISAMRKKLEDLTNNDFLETPEDVLLPDKQLEFKEEYLRILEAIDQLPPTRKLVFRLSRLEGMTYDEIAAELHISRNTVKEHIVLALNFLRTYLHVDKGLLSAFFFYCFS